MTDNPRARELLASEDELPARAAYIRDGVGDPVLPASQALRAITRALASPQDVGERAALERLVSAISDGRDLSFETNELNDAISSARAALASAPAQPEQDRWRCHDCKAVILAVAEPAQCPDCLCRSFSKLDQESATQPVDEDEIDSLLDQALGFIEPLTGRGEDFIWRPANKAWESLARARAILASRPQGRKVREALEEALKPFAKIPLCYPRRGSRPKQAALDMPAPGGAYTAADVERARKLLP